MQSSRLKPQDLQSELRTGDRTRSECFVKKQTKLRTCVACRRKMDQARLNRVVIQDGRLLADAKGTKHGRGAYTCSSLKCLRLGLVRGGFSRSLRRKFAEASPVDLAVAFRAELRMCLGSRKKEALASDSGTSGTEKIGALSFRLSEWESEVAEALKKGGSMMGLT